MGKRGYHIGDLSREEAVALLERNHVGRLAFAFRDRVDIEPITYVYHKEWLYARTAPGTKLTTVQHQPYVAFEVDEIRDRFHWRSVVVHGTIYFLDPERSPVDEQAYETALEVLRSLDAHTLTEDDPTPHRRALFRIHVDEIAGRAGAGS
jgi:nitroimidazol reductase NimA-like FMN-containing flavoprotein (pyridoxamine 5'-phosphate oxidase superfamily)